tara:strand:- start:263 stop:1102 length:840 start_codon:yes stop_codon:yes gene_type:complete
MKNDLTIIIAHYLPVANILINPLIKTLANIDKQKSKYNIEVIIADDGSSYSKGIKNNYSKRITIENDIRDIYILENNHLQKFIDKNNYKNNIINKWVYLPKEIDCMSKARVTNYAAKESNSDKILFLDDDNYFISQNSIENLISLFCKYKIIIGQIKDNNGRLRKYSSSRVQGTTIALKKEIFNSVGGLGEWTELFSCGVDSDFWIKLYNYYNNNNIRVCYTNQISTYDSCSKRWKKFTVLFRNYKIKKEFFKRYNCKNYKSKKYNLSRNKKLWIENLI